MYLSMCDIVETNFCLKIRFLKFDLYRISWQNDVLFFFPGLKYFINFSLCHKSADNVE